MNKWKLGFYVYTTMLVIALGLRFYFDSMTPIIVVIMIGVGMMALTGRWDRRPYLDRVLTDAVSPDGAITNGRGVPFDPEAEANRKHRAEVNNRLAHQNNEGRGPHFPDED